MCNQTLHRNRKPFCYHFLLSFSSTEILQMHSNDKQMIKIPKKCETFKSKMYTRKIKALFIIYGNF